ncbi:Transcriptional regulatory protein DevR (DosR) [Streptomyces sp. ADI96-02]|nr:Transcriptional regulatory protein DevR (DosR) [Streptomyces sp. ADI96-02]
MPHGPSLRADRPSPGTREPEKLDPAAGRQGRPPQEIGLKLYLAEKTVKNNISRILAQLGVERRVRVAVIATRTRSAG